MKKTIILTEADIRNIVKENIALLLEHQNVVNNLEYCIDTINSYWKNSENYWYITILQRVKDNNKVLDNNGNCIFNSKDGVMEDNMIGYAIVNGNTVDEAIDSLKYPVIHLYEKYAKLFGTTELKCNGQPISNIIKLCDITNSRAYMTQVLDNITATKNKEIKPDGFTPKNIKDLVGKNDSESMAIKFMWHSLHTRKGAVVRMIDCDVDDEDKLRQVVSLLKSNGIENTKILNSHNGYHIFFDPLKNGINSTKQLNALRKTINDQFSEKFGYNTNPRTGKKDSLVKWGGNNYSKILLYSSTGTDGRNVQHPDWMSKFK